MSWQLIETAPERTEVLGYWKGYRMPYDVTFLRNGEWYLSDDEPCISPTHWMPLPEPPNE